MTLSGLEAKNFLYNCSAAGMHLLANLGGYPLPPSPYTRLPVYKNQLCLLEIPRTFHCNSSKADAIRQIRNLRDHFSVRNFSCPVCRFSVLLVCRKNAKKLKKTTQHRFHRISFHFVPAAANCWNAQ